MLIFSWICFSRRCLARYYPDLRLYIAITAIPDAPSLRLVSQSAACQIQIGQCTEQNRALAFLSSPRLRTLVKPNTRLITANTCSTLARKGRFSNEDPTGESTSGPEPSSGFTQRPGICLQSNLLSISCLLANRGSPYMIPWPLLGSWLCNSCFSARSEIGTRHLLPFH